MSKHRARVIAFYLPQFYPIPENNTWWGKGFTEWTFVARARPLFPGHYQPRVPADLGFYDLRLPEARAAQAEMAAAHGIEGFCYWHYWFSGKRLLERPFEEVLALQEPDFPFCLAWANHSWSGIWHGKPGHILMEQAYPGMEDHKRHFQTLLKAFQDPRYIRVDGKPLFLIFKPGLLPDAPAVLDLWQELAQKAGLAGLYMTAIYQAEQVPDYKALGFDAATLCNQTKIIYQKDPLPDMSARPRFLRKNNGIPKGLRVYRYRDALPDFLEDGDHHPCLVPNWDNTPRAGNRGIVLLDSGPDLFKSQVKKALDKTEGKDPEHRLVFVKSWNEWAEGNHLEPDSVFGRGYLEALRDVVLDKSP